MRVALIEVQEALQKTVVLKLHTDLTTPEFKLELDEAIKAAQAALIWLYSNRTGYSGSKPNPEKKMKKFIIPKEDK
jgi:hypothetical protein